MTKILNLQWQKFQNHTSVMLQELYNSQRFSDVTLVCDDQTRILAHKFVVSAGSVRFPCKLCDHQATQPHHLKAHIKARHSDTKKE